MVISSRMKHFWKLWIMLRRTIPHFICTDCSLTEVFTATILTCMHFWRWLSSRDFTKYMYLSLIHIYTGYSINTRYASCCIGKNYGIQYSRSESSYRR